MKLLKTLLALHGRTAMPYYFNQYGRWNSLARKFSWSMLILLVSVSAQFKGAQAGCGDYVVIGNQDPMAAPNHSTGADGASNAKPWQPLSPCEQGHCERQPIRPAPSSPSRLPRGETPNLADLRTGSVSPLDLHSFHADLNASGLDGVHSRIDRPPQVGGFGLAYECVREFVTLNLW